MRIERQIDIEYETKKALKDYFTCYLRPLPKDYNLPNILIQQVGGSDAEKIDTFDVVLDFRAEDEAQANELMRTALGVLQKQVDDQTTAIRYMMVNSSGAWGKDPVRPDLAMCSARVRLVAHKEYTEVQTNV